MNYIKKLKSTILLSCLCASTALTSCDSDTPLEESASQNSTQTAKALNSLQTGDVLRFSGNGDIQTVSDLVFTGSQGIVGNGAAFYNYRKLSDSSFELELSGRLNAAASLQSAIINLLGGNSALASEFKLLVSNRFRPDFTPAEIARMKEILNPSGASIFGDTVDDLFSYDTNKYTLIVTSNVEDQFLGTMGGVYALDSTARRVSFRFPTSGELSISRFLPTNSQIPFIANQELFLDNAEVGTWVLTLNNIAGQDGFNN